MQVSADKRMPAACVCMCVRVCSLLSWRDVAGGLQDCSGLHDVVFVVSDAAADQMTDEPSAGERRSEPPWQGRTDGRTGSSDDQTRPERKVLLTAEGRNGAVEVCSASLTHNTGTQPVLKSSPAALRGVAARFKSSFAAGAPASRCTASLQDQEKKTHESATRLFVPPAVVRIRNEARRPTAARSAAEHTRGPRHSGGGQRRRKSARDAQRTTAGRQKQSHIAAPVSPRCSTQESSRWNHQDGGGLEF